MQAIGPATTVAESPAAGQSEKGEKSVTPENSFETILDRMNQAGSRKKANAVEGVPAGDSDSAENPTNKKAGLSGLPPKKVQPGEVSGTNIGVLEQTEPEISKAKVGQVKKSTPPAKAPADQTADHLPLSKTEDRTLRKPESAPNPGLAGIASGPVDSNPLKTDMAVNAKRQAGGMDEKTNHKAKSGGSGEVPGQSELASLLAGMREPPNKKADMPNQEKKQPELPDSDFRLSSADNGKGGRISVVDMRIKAARQSDNHSGEGSNKAPGEQSAALHDIAGREPNPQAAVSREPVAFGSATTPEPATPPQTLAENLAARIRDSGAADIVKAAQIVLQDADTGVIRLQLEPASLGRVKIELKIADKKISGVIVVESDLAGKAFKDSLESLRDAFSASGLETAALEVEVRNGNHEQAERQANAELAQPYYSKHVKDLDAAVPVLAATTSRDGLLNVIV